MSEATFSRSWEDVYVAQTKRIAVLERALSLAVKRLTTCGLHSDKALADMADSFVCQAEAELAKEEANHANQ